MSQYVQKTETCTETMNTGVHGSHMYTDCTGVHGSHMYTDCTGVHGSHMYTDCTGVHGSHMYTDCRRESKHFCGLIQTCSPIHSAICIYFESRASHWYICI